MNTSFMPRRSACLALISVCSLVFAASSQSIKGQESASANLSTETATRKMVARDESLNYDVQVHLLIASNNADESKNPVPSSLTPIIKSLRAALPFSNYRLATTFLNRVKAGGIVSVNGTGDLLGTNIANEKSTTPTFHNLAFEVSSSTDSSVESYSIVQMRRFALGLKIPVFTGNSNNPVIQYQDTGLNTQISLRESEPTVVGTMSGAPGGGVFVVIVTAKRSVAMLR